MSALLECTGVSVSWPTPEGRLRAVREVSLHLDRGETLGLVGESGCGKTTLGRALSGLVPLEAGEVRLHGQLFDARALSVRRQVQPVFQDPAAALDPRCTVEQAIAEGLVVHGLAAGRRGARVRQLLDQVGLAAATAGRLPHELSAGQRQRVCIARALAVEPQLLVLDEPVSALDVSVQAQMLTLLHELQRAQGLAYLFISHDLGVIAHLATRVAVMYAGRLVEVGPSDAVLGRPRHPYTQALLASVPSGDPRRRPTAKHQVRGEAPSAFHPPSGCAFHPRCPHAFDRCPGQLPPLIDVSPTHRVACLKEPLP